MVAVPELAAKKAKRAEAWATEAATAAAEARKQARQTRSLIFAKAAAYAREYQQQVCVGVERMLMGAAKQNGLEEQPVLSLCSLQKQHYLTYFYLDARARSFVFPCRRRT
jgi:hypothetical protein